jgi:hypothetical protein
MIVNLQRTNLTLPVAAGTEARLYPLSRPARAHSGYNASGIIDTVEIRRGNFQALPANRQVKNLSTQPPTGKGVYIDLWA